MVETSVALGRVVPGDHVDERAELLDHAMRMHRQVTGLHLFAAALMFREYHLMKSSTTILYLTVGLLGFVAWYAYPVLSPYLRGRRVMTLLAMVGMCYLLTQTLDFDVFKERHVIFSVTEEIMEVTGHCFVLLLSLTAKPAA